MLPQLQSATGLLKTAPQTAIDAFICNNNKIAGLTKQCGPIAVELALVRLLKEVFTLTLSPVTPDQLAAMAEEIRTSYYYLGFEEIILALKNGINGKYEKIYGHINYQHIASWMHGFERERVESIQNYRDNSHEAVTSRGNAIDYLASLPEESLKQIAVMSEKLSAEKTTELSKEEINHRLRDGERLVQFDKHKDKIQTFRVVEIMEEADENDWFRTWLSASRELDSRINIPVRDFIDRVYDLQDTSADDDMRFMERYKPELFIQLKPLAMILGFEEETKPLTEQEKELLPEFIRCLQKELYHGKGNEITNKSIREGYARKGTKVSDSRIRKIINHIRANNLVPRLCANSRGYFIAKTDQELNDYITSLKQRVAAIRKVLSALEESQHVNSQGKKVFATGPSISQMAANLNIESNNQPSV